MVLFCRPYYFGTIAPKHWWKRIDHCVYNYMGIENCTKVAKPLLDIKSAHFTACQKPWICFWEVHAEFQNHHCVYLQSQWWHFRDMFQRRVGKYAPPALEDRCDHKNGKRIPSRARGPRMTSAENKKSRCGHRRVLNGQINNITRQVY